MTEFGADLRDYFAAHALQGLLASSTDGGTFENIIEYAYKYADAMIEERNRG